MENELSADYTLDDERAAVEVPTAHMHPASAFFFGAWYSIILASAMSAGVKYLHPDTPASHGILQGIAWAIGSGIAIAMASRLARGQRLLVGVGSTLVSASIWVILLYFFWNDMEGAVADRFFGHAISLQAYLIAFALLIFIVGLASAFFGATSRDDEELTAFLLQVPSGHWFWLWVAAFAWVTVLPMILYLAWLQVATILFSVIHPSLWFSEGYGLSFGFLGMIVIFKGIEISLRTVSDKGSYGAVVWKRVLMFIVGTALLAGVVGPFLLNLDIVKMKDMPVSLGSHPWWVL